jgi:hypothetical protein
MRHAAATAAAIRRKRTKTIPMMIPTELPVDDCFEGSVVAIT